MTHHDDIPMTPQELRERYGFKPGEREAIEAEMAERAKPIEQYKREEAAQ